MTTPAPRAADATPATAPGTVICAACDLSGGPFEPEEALYLIGLHNDLHHGGFDPAVDPATPVGPVPPARHAGQLDGQPQA